MKYHFDIKEIQFAPDVSTIVESILKQTASDDHPEYFLDLMWEGYVFANWQANYQLLIDIIRREKPNAKIFVLANSHHSDCDLAYTGITDVLFVDYFLYRTCKEILEFKTSPINQTWDNTKDKFLCLGGRIKDRYRKNLFVRLYNDGLLDKAIYSFTPDESFELSQQELELVRTLPESPYTGDGMYYGSLFADSLFQLIVETRTFGKNKPDKNPWITEKTWISIINKQPFIMYGDAGTLETLSNFGFHTFEKYLEFPNYENNLDSISANVNHWLKNIGKYAVIKQEVEHNFYRLIDLYKNNTAKIQNFIEKHNVDLNIVPTDYNVLENVWRIFYNDVKSDSWPKNVAFRDFGTLPKHIQYEIIHQHGLTCLNQWPHRLVNLIKEKNYDL